MSVVIETTIGDITVDLYLKERPNTCLNFLKLCKIKYYNLCLFYKIEKNFIAQSGDPTATGRGGESVFCHLYGDQAKYFDTEFKPRLKHTKLGTLSMVNNGNNMNGSQFFITLSENLTYLDEEHTVFGEVAEGFDVLLKLNDAICDNNNRPYQDIRITHTVILHDPFDDPKGLEIPNASPEPTKEMLESNYIGADEEIDDNKGKTTEEVEEKIKESEAKARATILEMVGDIPDADVKPPENVLFVCKLNPVTTSEDLEIIFSRFGKILSCEVIKDKKTGDSLQYAFIEFEKEEDCEAAYFKMDNVLIDDRRIHVDFSQSVSKMFYGKDKFQSSKPVKSNISLKNNDRSDGYDLIFDMEDDNRSRKQKSKELSQHETLSKKNKHRAHSKENSHKKKNEQSSYKNDKYQSEKEKRYRDAEHSSHSSSRNKDYDQYSKSKSRYTSQSSFKGLDDRRDSRNYRDSDYYKISPESREYRSYRQKSRYDSSSPDRSIKSQDRHRKQSPYGSQSSRTKHSVSPDRLKKKQGHGRENSPYSSRSKRKPSLSPDRSKYQQKKKYPYDSCSYRTKQSVSPDRQKKIQDQPKEPSPCSSRYKRKHSVSPDRLKEFQNRHREQSPYKSYSSRTKHSDKTDSPEYLTKNKKSTYLEENEREKSKVEKEKLKRSKLVHSSEKRGKSKVSRSSSSSSSSDSDSSSSSSSSSSDSKTRKKSHQKQKLSNSKSSSKSHKKRKYSS